MFEAYVDGKRRKVEVMGANKRSIAVAFLKSQHGVSVRHVRSIPYICFSWKSDDWYEVSRRTV